jgi:hypothetical protein
MDNWIPLDIYSEFKIAVLEGLADTFTQELTALTIMRYQCYEHLTKFEPM